MGKRSISGFSVTNTNTENYIRDPLRMLNLNVFKPAFLCDRSLSAGDSASVRDDVILGLREISRGVDLSAGLN